MFAARVAVVSVAVLTAPAAAADPAADLALERRLRTTLAADPRLTSLTVSVVDRVAVVGGPVPTPEAKRAAEAVVRSVDGLAAVRLSLWVPLAADPFVERVRKQLAPPRPAPPPRPPVVADDSLPLALAPADAPPPPRVLPPPEPVTAAREAGGRRGWLGPPSAGGGTIPPTQLPPVPPDRLARLTAGDVRFRRLTVDLSPTGVATIGGVGDPADGWALANLLRRQPGVTRVVVGDIRER